MPGSWDNVRGDACAVRRASRRIRGSPSTCTCAKFVHMCAWHEVCHSIMAREYSCVFNFAHACSSLVFILWSCTVACDHGACIPYYIFWSWSLMALMCAVRRRGPPGAPAPPPATAPQEQDTAAAAPPRPPAPPRRRARGGAARELSLCLSRGHVCVCDGDFLVHYI